mgnify:CR=1 FL=1
MQGIVLDNDVFVIEHTLPPHNDVFTAPAVFFHYEGWGVFKSKETLAAQLRIAAVVGRYLQWNMYSSLESGIRIKLKANPFKLYKNSPDDISKIKLLSIIDSSTEAFQHSYIPLRRMLEQHFSCLHAMTPSFLHQVKYTNDQDKLYPNLILKHDNQILMMPDQLGLYKNEYWSFQKEWRYKLMCFPIGPDNSMEQLNIMASLMVNGIVKQPFSYYDLKLDDDAFSHMEITLSPKISPGYRLIVNSLIEKYNPTAQIYDSSLIGLV